MPPAPPVLHALQVDQVDVELARRVFLDEEVAAVQIAVIVAHLVEAGRHGGDFADQPPQVAVARRRAGLVLGGEALPEEVIQLLVADQLFGEHERFQEAVAVQLLAEGDQPHGGDDAAGHVDAAPSPPVPCRCRSRLR